VWWTHGEAVVFRDESINNQPSQWMARQ
jgi:hypothetical protein